MTACSERREGEGGREGRNESRKGRKEDVSGCDVTLHVVKGGGREGGRERKEGVSGCDMTLHVVKGGREGRKDWDARVPLVCPFQNMFTSYRYSIYLSCMNKWQLILYLQDLWKPYTAIAVMKASHASLPYTFVSYFWVFQMSAIPHVFGLQL